MTRKPLRGLLALAACTLLCFTSCLGPNRASGHLANWHEGFENEWAQQGVYFVTWPGYLLTGIGDILIFNPWQWWFGDNPISRPDQDHGASVF